MISILFLTADPSDASRLRLGEELREIQEKFRISKSRDTFSLESRMSLRPTDISQALLDLSPNIVHFSGHGTSSGAICLENKTGKMHPVQPDALAALFEQFSAQIDCVVLNACYSVTQAKAIAKHIRFVIGMNQAIGDKAAIAFSIGFYQALGAGRTIDNAYKFGCIQIRLQNIPEHLTPELIQEYDVSGLNNHKFSPLSNNKQQDNEPVINDPAGLVRRANKKRGVHLGLSTVEEEPVSGLLPKVSLNDLLKHQNCAVAKHLLTSNTFFHGKVGFYELIMRKIYSVVGEKTHEIHYLHSIQNLHEVKNLPQLTLLPGVESDDALNDLVAKSLRHKSKSPVWLVANPSSVYKHLLLSFHNFFITSSNPDEIKYLQNIFSLPKIIVDLLLHQDRMAVFITDFEPVVDKAYLPIAIIRLDRLD